MIGSRGLSASRTNLLATAAAAALALAVGPAMAAPVLPTGGVVKAGSASIGAPSGGAISIKQTSSKAILDWSSFSIGQGGTVSFQNGSGATLNRVTGASLSSIDGLLSGTGSVYLLNPNGVIIGKTGVVEVGGTFVASTLDLTDKDFLTGSNFTLSGPSSASVINLGKVGSLGGDVALIAATVENDGTISAGDGTAGLIAGHSVLLRDSTLDDGKFAVLVGGADTSATNAGLIEAADAELRAEQGNVYALAGDTAGVIRATGVKAGDGKVWLVADQGTLDVAGTIEAEGPNGARGAIETSGGAVKLDSPRIDAHGGTWLLDPDSLEITQTAAQAISSALTGGTSVTEQTGPTQDGSGAATTVPDGNGDITLDSGAAIAWTGGASLTLSAYRNIVLNGTISLTTGTLNLTAGTGNTGAVGPNTGAIAINAPITVSGAGAVNLTAAYDTQTVSGTSLLELSFGNGGHIDFTGTDGLGNPLGTLQIADTSGTLQSYTLLNSLAQAGSTGPDSGTNDIAGIDSNAAAAGDSGLYALANNVDGTGTTFSGALVGAGSNTFSGTFEGLGHTVSNLTINDTTTNGYDGLFGRSFGVIRDLGLVGGSVSGGDYIGGLVGWNVGAISNAYATGAVSGGGDVGGLVGVNDGGAIAQAYATGAVSGSEDNVGGLVGFNDTGTIAQVYATGAVSGYGDYVGGLVGFNYYYGKGTITQAYATGAVSGGNYVGGLLGSNNGGTIAQAYATGAVSGSGDDVGGLVGDNDGTISNAYATGAVSGSGDDVGGLVGYNDGAITNAYATGDVSGLADVGGLVGYDNGGSYTATYWDVQTSGQTAGVGNGSPSGVTGETTFQLQNGGLPSGFDPTVWGGGSGGLYPYLTSFFPNGVQALSGIAFSDRGVTPLASGSSGAEFVYADVNGTAEAPVSTGANGYYYLALPAGTLTSGGTPILAYTTGTASASDPATGALLYEAHATRSGLDIWGGTLTAPTSVASVSTAPTTVSGLLGDSDSISALSNATLLADAEGSNPQVNLATNTNITNVGYVATHTAGFSVDQLSSTDDVYVLGEEGSGPISVTQPLTLSGTTALTLESAGQLAFNAPVTATAAGVVKLGAGYDTTTVPGASLLELSFGPGDSLSFTGTDGSGNPLGTLTINGQGYTLLNGLAQPNSTSPDNGTNDIAGIDSNAAAAGDSGLYALANNVDGTGTTFSGALVGAGSNTFSGTFEGLGHTVSNLTINDTTTNGYDGLFGQSSGLIRDLGLVDGSVSGSGSFIGGLVGFNHRKGVIAQAYATGAVNGGGDVGGLVGVNSGGTIAQAYATGAVGGGSNVGGLVGENDGGAIAQAYATGAVGGSGDYVGGLVGFNYGDGTIAQAYATGAVSGAGFDVGGLVGVNSSANGGTASISNAYATGAVSGSDSDVGGLVGWNDGAISNAYATGAVSGSGDDVGGLLGYNDTGAIIQAYATGAVSGSNNVGGLVGYNDGDGATASIDNAYATGAVSGSGDDVGGLVGQNNSDGGTASISNAYATGAVSGLANIGGLVGYDNGGSYTATYWDVQTSGQTAGVGNGFPSGVTGETTFQLQNGGLPSGFDPTVWGGGSGGLYPYLKSFFPNGVQALSGIAFSDRGVTPLASGSSGAEFVYADVDGTAEAPVSTGANGYYYLALPAGTLTSGGTPLLAYTTGTANASDTATGARLDHAQDTRSGLDIWGGTLIAPTSAASVSAAPATVTALLADSDALSGTSNATLLAGATGSNSADLSGLSNVGYVVTNASGFTVDQLSASGDLYAQGEEGSGPITVTQPLTLSGAKALTLESAGALAFNASVTATGAGVVKLGAGIDTTTVPGASLLELSFAQGASLDFTGTDVGGAPLGLLSINGQSYTLLNSLGQGSAAPDSGTNDIAGIDNNTAAGADSGFYALATNLDGSATTFTSALAGVNVGGFPTLFVGTFEGLGHTISNLTINDTSGNGSDGLFGTVGSGGVIRDVNLAGGSVSASGAFRIGDLVGDNQGGLVVHASASGAVSGQQAIGGLVGLNDTGGVIAQSYATGTASGLTDVGGLVGENDSTTTEVYATGAVGASQNNVGGLVGLNYGTVSQAFATGAVSGAGYSAGGLVGFSNNPVTSGYYDYQTTGTASGTQSNGSVGLSTPTLQSEGLSAFGFDQTVWGGGAGGLYPYLTGFYPSAPQAISGLAYTDAGVTLAASSSGTNTSSPLVYTVNGLVNGQALQVATTGANGYYYLLSPAGLIDTSGSPSSVLAYEPSSTPGVPLGAAVQTTNGNVTGLNIYGGYLSYGVTATTVSQLEASYAGIDVSAIAAAADPGATLNLSALPAVFATQSSFTFDQATDLTGSDLGVLAAAPGAGITVNAPITLGAHILTLAAPNGALAIEAPIDVEGAGTVNLVALVDALELSFGPSGAVNYETTAGSPATSSQGGSLTINGQSYTLLYKLAESGSTAPDSGTNDIAGIDTAGDGGFYALATNVDGTGTTFTNALAGAGVNTFSGTFEGLGHTVSNLTVNASQSGAVGLFGTSTGTIRDIGLTGGSVTAGENSNAGDLVGFNSPGGIVSNAHAAGAVTGGDNDYAGGLVGANEGAINNAYATGAVSGGNPSGVGGLTGYNIGTVVNAYATGAVRGGANFYAGGLVGFNDGGTITASFATGAVGGASGSTVGGLVGNNTGTVSNAYWDTTTSGQSSGIGTNSGSGGATGLTTAELQTGGLPSGFDPTVWGGGTNGLYPYLTSFFPNGVQALSGVAYSDRGVTPLASGSSGAEFVYADVDGTAETPVSTGANGYYYFALPAGTLTSGGTPVLAYTTGTANASDPATGARLDHAQDTRSGLDIWGGTLIAPTSAASVSTAPTTVAGLLAASDALSGTSNATLLAGATGSNSVDLIGLSNVGYVVTNASGFTVDQLSASGDLYAQGEEGSGPITVTQPLTLDGAKALTLESVGPLTFSAPVTANGAGVVTLGGAIDTATVPGASLLELSFGPGASLSFTGSDVNGNPLGALTINGQSYTLLNGLAGTGSTGPDSGTNDIAGIDNAGDGGFYALATDIDGTGTTFTSALAGAGGNIFAGTFEGLGHAISNLTISDSSNDYVGLFGQSSGTIRDLRIASGSVTGSESGDPLYVGGLVGYNTGTLANVSASDSVTASADSSDPGYAGGLAGYNTGFIQQAYATGAVAVTSGKAGYAGGLVGENDGTISSSYATGAVSVASGKTGYAGGLVGYNTGPIANAYAMGPVTGANTTDLGGSLTSDTGGLVGYNNSSLTNVYATGLVTGGTAPGGTVGTGGLVGEDDTGSYTSAYYDTLTTGQNGPDPSGVQGLTTSELQNNGLAYLGFDSAIWGGATNGLYPYLLWQFAPNTTPQLLNGYVTGALGAPVAGAAVQGYIDGTQLGGFSATGANGYYYLLGPAGTIGSGSAALVYTGSSGSPAAARLQGVSDSTSNFNLWNGLLIAPTAATTLSQADATPLTTQDSALLSQALGSNPTPNLGPLVQGYIATDPTGFTVDTIPTDLGSQLYVQTTTGDLTVAAGLGPNPDRLGLFSNGALTINSPITIGSGATAGEVELAAGVDDATVPGVDLLRLSFGPAGSISYSDTNPADGNGLIINGQPYTLLYKLADATDVGPDSGTDDIAGIDNADDTGFYALASSVDGTGTTFASALAGAQSNTFSGVFEGLGNTISNLTITDTANSNVGLFGQSGGALRDLRLSGGTVAGSSEGAYVGALVGYSDGVVANDSASTTVTGGTDGTIGGLVGYNDVGGVSPFVLAHTSIVISPPNPGVVIGSSASGPVGGSDEEDVYAGGLVGTNAGAILNSHATGPVQGGDDDAVVGGLVGYNDGYRSLAAITDAYATGTVTGGSNSYAGGLVVYNDGDGGAASISNAYASGAVSGGYAGGLVGLNDGDSGAASITNAYATGAVTGEFAGGLVGYNNANEGAASITNAYAMGAVYGDPNGAGGLVGLNDGSTGAATITSAYATGAVSGASNSALGGLVGETVGGSAAVTNGYYDTLTTGFTGTESGGATGLTTGQLQGALPSGFDPTVWGTGSNLYPYLKSFYATAPNSISGFAYSDAGVTPLASSFGKISGSPTDYAVSGLIQGTPLGSATTGANGYYYLLSPAGTISGTAPGSAVLAYTSGPPAGAAVTQATGTVTGLNIYGGYLSYPMTATTYSALPLPAVDVLALANQADPNGVSSATSLPAVFATPSSFTIDTGGSLTFANDFGVLTVGAGTGITVDDPITLTSGGALTLAAPNGALTVNAPITVEGAGAVHLAAAYDTSLGVPILKLEGDNATLTYENADGTAATSSQGGSLTINGQAYTLLYKLAESGSTGPDTGTDDIAGIDNAGDSGFYALATNVDGTGTTFASALAGAGANTFSGVLEGLGHTVGNLTINDSADVSVGLFGSSAGAIRDLGVIGGSVTAGASGTSAGDLVGVNLGVVWNDYASGAISGAVAGGLVGENNGGDGTALIGASHAVGAVSGGSLTDGGLVGYNYANGGAVSIVNAYASGTVSGSDAGGLVGYNDGHNGAASIANAYATGVVSGFEAGGLVGVNDGDGGSAPISSAYATGAVAGTFRAGGLVGRNDGDNGVASITNTYAMGAVYGGSGSAAGGLVGVSTGDGGTASITSAYATGAVSGAPDATLGGLVARNIDAGTVTNGDYDTSTTGFTGSDPGGAAGLTTSALQGALPTGFDPTVWGTGPNLYPYLKSFYATAPNSISGFAYSDAGVTLEQSSSGTGVASPLVYSVGAMVNGQALPSATTGANGYYYLLSPPGLISPLLLASSVMTYEVGTTPGAPLGAAVAQTYGNVTGLNIYGGYLSDDVTATTMTQLQPYLGTDIKTIAADADPDSTLDLSSLAAVFATQSSFTFDQATDLSSGGDFGVLAAAPGAGISVEASLTGGSHQLVLAAPNGSLAIDAPMVVKGSGAVDLRAEEDTTSFPGFSAPSLSFGSSGSLTFANADGSPATTSQGATLTINDQSYGLLYNAADLAGVDAAGDAANYAVATDFSGTSTLALAPVGATAPFTGIFEGLNHTIDGLTISTIGPQAGVIGTLGASGVVRDLHLTSLSVTGSSYVGGLVGDDFGLIDNVSVSGSVGSTVNGGVGGVAGVAEGGSEISGVTAGVNVTVNIPTAATASDNNVGGLAGASFGTITNSSATGAVTSNRDNVGGLVGYNSGPITLSTASGAVQGANYVGGLVGLNYASLQGDGAVGNVTATDSTAGGLVGLNASSGTISASNASAGTVAADPSYSAATPNLGYAGGLVGWNQGQVSGSTAQGNVSGSAWIGGFVGLNQGGITTSVATGTATGGKYVGGLAGWNDTAGTIQTSYSTGAVTATADSQQVGAQSDVGLSDSYAGGLVGVNFGSITNAYATGNVSGVQVVGGLVGTNMSGGGSVTNAYSTGQVSASTGAIGYSFGVQAGEVTNVYGFPSLSGQPATGYAPDGDPTGGVQEPPQEDGTLYPGFDPDTWQSNTDGPPTLTSSPTPP